MNIFSRITARTMAQNRTRTLVTIIGVILSTAMITAVAAFGASFLRAMLEYTILRDGDWHLAAYSVPDEWARQLTGDEEVKRWAAVTELGYAPYQPLRKYSPGMPYLYVESLSEEAMRVLPIELAEGRMPENEREILIPQVLSANEDEEEKTKIGDILTLELGERILREERLNQNNPLITQEENGEAETFLPRKTQTFQVVGVYKNWVEFFYSGAGYDVLAGPCSSGEAQMSGGVTAAPDSQEESAERTYQNLYVTLKNPRKVYQFQKKWSEALRGENCGFTVHESQLRWLGVADNDNYYRVLRGLIGILMLVIVIGSVTLIYNAFSISLWERTAQFGLLSSIGATKKQLRSSMRYEALLVCGAGIPLGLLAGVGGTGITLHYVGKSIMNWVHGVPMEVKLVVLPESMAAAAALAFFTVMISVWIPSRRIRKISPLEAIRSNTDVRIQPREVKTGGWIGRIFGLEGMLAEKNYKRDRKKYRATVVSLAMSIVLFMAAALFNSYLIRTGSFVLDAPKVDLEYMGYNEGETGREEYNRVGQLIAETEDVTKVISYRRTRLILDVPLEYLKKETAAALRQEQGDAGEKSKKIEAELMILPDLVFENYAKQLNIDAYEYENADHIRLLYRNVTWNYQSDTQRYERCQLLEKRPEEQVEFGRFQYGKDNVEFQKLGQLELADEMDTLPEELEREGSGLVALIPASLYERFSARLNRDSVVTLFNIQCDNPSRVYERISEELKRLDLEDVGYLTNLTAQYESDRNVLAAIKVLTYGFIILISLIAVANVFNTISTNLMLRRKEFAMLRSMGMSPRGMRKMMNYECLIYGVRAVIYGIFFSLLLSGAIHKVIGLGADAEFLMPWKYLAVAVAGTFLVVFCSMLYTMRKIRNNNIVDELKMN